jgi:16S rRNA (uracil1498-N3)-methyltransferase
MRRFYAPKESFEGGSVRLDEDETRHLRDVLRLKPRVEISVFDGEGTEYLARIETITKKETTATIAKQIEPAAPESPLEITLGSVAIPGDKYDLIVQKAVELGVVRFVPLASVRSEVRLKDLPKKLTRWRRIALDAAKQCGRARLMTIDEPSDVDQFIAASDEGAARIFFSEREGLKLPLLESPKKIITVIGPKGGWEDSELAAARDNGFEIVTLGGRIMRAETAAIALTAILQHRFGDIN